MNGYKIEISDILGSKKININTPVIILTSVPKRYLVPAAEKSSIYNIITERLHHDLEKRYQFIERFVPIGQLYIADNDLKKKFSIVMANTRIVPTTRSFEEIKKNIWVGVIRKNDKINRSLGTVYSEDKPLISVPVFPVSFLKKLETDIDDIAYADTYSDPSYGRWILNKYKFNVDKTHLKMIDSSGDISNMFIPTIPRNIIDDNYNDSDKKFNHKVYFTAQGSIVSDTNCVPPKNNMSRITLNECNGTDEDDALITSNQQSNKTHLRTQRKSSSDGGSSVVLGAIIANDDDMLEMNVVPAYTDVFSPLKKSKLTKHGKTLVFKEKSEPWFADSSIVGSAASIVDPHKITGIITSIIDGTVYDDTVYGDEDEDNTSFISDCASKELIIGYSRDDIANKCKSSIEQFEKSDNSDVRMDYINNSIMYVMCIIIIILMVYQFADKKVNRNWH